MRLTEWRTWRQLITRGNWLVSFFSEGAHCTDCCTAVTSSQHKSMPHDITRASIIQESAIGPVTHIINAANLKTVTPVYRAMTLWHYITAKFVIFLYSVISQDKVVALDRWGRIWNHLSMTPRLTTDYAKHYCFDLHWLRVPERITYKLCVLLYNCLHGTAPPVSYTHLTLPTIYSV